MTLRVFPRANIPIESVLKTGDAVSRGIPPARPLQLGARQAVLLREMAASGEFRALTHNDHVGELTRSYLYAQCRDQFIGKPRQVVAMPRSLREALIEAQRRALLFSGEINQVGGGYYKGRWKRYPAGYKPVFGNVYAELRNKYDQVVAKITYEAGSYKLQRAPHEYGERFNKGKIDDTVAGRLGCDVKRLNQYAKRASQSPGQRLRLRNACGKNIGSMIFAEGVYYFDTAITPPQIRILHTRDGLCRKEDVDRAAGIVYFNDITSVIVQIEDYKDYQPIHLVPPPVLTFEDVREEFEAVEFNLQRSTAK